MGRGWGLGSPHPPQCQRQQCDGQPNEDCALNPLEHPEAVCWLIDRLDQPTMRVGTLREGVAGIKAVATICRARGACIEYSSNPDMLAMTIHPLSVAQYPIGV